MAIAPSGSPLSAPSTTTLYAGPVNPLPPAARVSEVPCEWGNGLLQAAVLAPESTLENTHANTPENGLANTPKNAAAIASAATDEVCLSSDAFRCRIGLLTELTSVESRFNLHCLLNYVDVCSFSFDVGQNLPLQTWWSLFKAVPQSRARVELLQLDEAIKALFYRTLPVNQPTQWMTYPLRVRQDINTLLAIAHAVLADPNHAAPPGCEPLTYRHDVTYRDVALALSRAAALGGRFDPSETGYLLGLSLTLREHGPAIRDWFSSHIDVSPHAATRFVMQSVIGRAVDDPDSTLSPSGAHAHTSQCHADLAALVLYMGRISHSCMFESIAGPTLTTLRAHFARAVADEPVEERVLAELFVMGADDQNIYHDGRVFRNAVGMDAPALVAAWSVQGSDDFRRLAPDRQLTLVRRRMLALSEHPDFRVGDVKQSMANSLMRMDSILGEPQYVRYDSNLALLEAWQARHKQWLARRDYVLSPELYASILGVEALGIQKTSLAWYQTLWETKILAPLYARVIVRATDSGDLAAMRKWLQKITSGHWDAKLQRWLAATTEQYADAVMATADVLYQLSLPENSPEQIYIRTRTPAGVINRPASIFPRLLDGIPDAMKYALYDVAAEFDLEPLKTERILSEDWLYSALRIMQHGHHQAVLAFQTKPVFSVEVEAYLALLDAGVAEEDMGTTGAYIVSATHALDYRPMVGEVFEKFMEVIRSPRRDDLLVLAGGKKIYPHHIVDNAFDDYLASLPSHPWIVATAKDNLRKRGVPFLPSVLNPEIERLIGPLRDSASKATILGTHLADIWFGQLPISSPMLKLTRAIRDGKFSDAPYYALLLARDFMGVMALAKAMGASYLSTLSAGGRLAYSRISSSALMLRLPTGRSMREWAATAPAQARLRKSSALERLAFEAQDFKRRSTGSRGQGKAARHFSRSEVFRRDQGAGVWGTDRFNQRNWEGFRALFSPPEGARAGSELRSVSRNNAEGSFSSAHLAMQTRIEDMGERTGIIGLASIDGDTEIGGQALADRVTVAQAYQWLLQAIDRKPRDIDALIERHITIRYEGNVAIDLLPPASTAYDIRLTLTRLYGASPILQALVNWYDSHALEGAGLDLVVDGRCDYPTAIQVYGAFRTEIRLPGSPLNMPLVMTESGFIRLSFKAALVEALVSAITRTAPPKRLSSERGATVFFTNLILSQSGDAYVPRLSAAAYRRVPGKQSDFLHMAQARDILPVVRMGCEAEDQYFERLGLFNEYSIDHLRFQGGLIKNRPTVQGVCRTLSRIGYREAVESAALIPLRARDSTAFFNQFDPWFTLQRTTGDDTTYTTVRELFWDCYVNSTLFQLLVDHAGKPPDTPWRIHHHPLDEAGMRYDGALFGPSNSISAAWQHVRYLGLLHPNQPIDVLPTTEGTETSEDIATSADARPALPVAISSIGAMEPFRRILDGVVSVLTREALQGTPAVPFADRGVAVWVTDMVLWDLGWTLNKRLVRGLEVHNDLETYVKLLEVAPAARRAARVEDDYISRWIGRVLPEGEA